MADLTDDELIARCRAGDEPAFAELVDRYKRPVFGLVARLVPDRSQVEDIAQEVFLRVHRGLPYFRGEARLSTWIYRIVTNLCLQERSRPRLSEVSLDEPLREGGAASRADRAGAMDAAFTEMELRDRLEKAIAQLPDRYRVLIAAHYLQGVQYEALAEALDLPMGTVKTSLHRARRQLREILAREGV
jgi:RNA polymerase sigma-70 factor (ECF subfamily)